ncbi:unnamed protein product, partial [Didymodactylos carnosus]
FDDVVNDYIVRIVNTHTDETSRSRDAASTRKQTLVEGSNPRKMALQTLACHLMSVRALGEGPSKAYFRALEVPLEQLVG